MTISHWLVSLLLLLAPFSLQAQGGTTYGTTGDAPVCLNSIDGSTIGTVGDSSIWLNRSDNATNGTVGGSPFWLNAGIQVDENVGAWRLPTPLRGDGLTLLSPCHRSPCLSSVRTDALYRARLLLRPSV